MTLHYRHNFKWRINELLSLQREYELLEWTIQEIACKHERTIDAILYRLQHEGFIDSWIDARGYQEYSKTLDCLVGSLDSNVNIYNFKKNLTVNTDFIDDDYCDDVIDDNDSDYHDNSDDSDSDSDYQEDDEYHDAKNISSLSQRVWSLETAVKDIKSMIGTLVSRFTSSTTSSSSINTVI
jgi:hypothetical protein